MPAADIVRALIFDVHSQICRSRGKLPGSLHLSSSGLFILSCTKSYLPQRYQIRCAKDRASSWRNRKRIHQENPAQIRVLPIKSDLNGMYIIKEMHMLKVHGKEEISEVKEWINEKREVTSSSFTFSIKYSWPASPPMIWWLKLGKYQNHFAI